MLILIVEFQWQLTDINKDPDDLLNDLLNCSLSSFHSALDRLELLRAVNSVISYGFVEFEGYSLDVLLEFFSCFHTKVVNELYDDLKRLPSFSQDANQNLAKMTNMTISTSLNSNNFKVGLSTITIRGLD